MTDQPPAPSGSAEDRKAASALASLDRVDVDDDNNAGACAGANLAAAVSKAAQSTTTKTTSSSSTAAATTTGGKGNAAAAAKNVRLDPADVALIIDQLELTKQKATELLKRHGGDAVQAMRAYVRAYV